jgi:hypothetical protein
MKSKTARRWAKAAFEVAFCDLKNAGNARTLRKLLVPVDARSASLYPVPNGGSMTTTGDLAPMGSIERRILVVRGHKVILDSDLAALYGVLTGRLNEQVKRNASRFPADFVFRLTAEEAAGLISQIATSNGGRGGRRKLPYVFTEHGAVMAASVLNTPRAVEVSVFVVRAFVRLREALATHKDLARRLDDIERKVAALADVPDKLADHEQAITAILEAIRQLMAPATKSKARPMGFRPDLDGK